jgi:small-conductance mechanosensitive channel
VNSEGTAEFERCHFVSLEKTSLDFELVYYVPSNEFKQALDVQQRINLAILRRFAEQGLELAASS